MAGKRGVFVTKQFDLQVYKLLQALRVAHGDASQWEILQAALIHFGNSYPEEQKAALRLARLAPSDQPEAYEVQR